MAMSPGLRKKAALSAKGIGRTYTSTLCLTRFSNYFLRFEKWVCGKDFDLHNKLLMMQKSCMDTCIIHSLGKREKKKFEAVLYKNR